MGPELFVSYVLLDFIKIFAEACGPGGGMPMQPEQNDVAVQLAAFHAAESDTVVTRRK